MPWFFAIVFRLLFGIYLAFVGKEGCWKNAETIFPTPFPSFLS
jgi:hypothetical protein